jgi:2-polyprenyl-6-methoxyphenol hydroxylase-like FAD-dependent oxidoreductase
MTDADRLQVLVVGAGPTGLAAAAELARRDVRVAIVDAASGPHPGSRGKGMQPRTLELLDSLGVAGRLISTGRFRLPSRHYDADGGSRVVDLHPDTEPTPDSPYARSLLLPQWRVEQSLRELLDGQGLRVRWGAQVVGLTQRPDRVRVELADGEVLEADYVIGCDGGSSTVRGLLGVSFLGETHEDVRMLLGDVELEGLDRDYWHIWTGSGLFGLALCPLPATDMFQFQAPIPPEHDGEPTLPALQAMVDQVVGAGRVRLRRASWLSRWRLNVRMVEQYRVDRVFLAGDAAHVHSPAGGQGMNTGIQDAVNLGWKLAHVLAGADDRLLDSYQAERLPVAAGVLGLSTRLGGQAPGARPSAERTESLQLGITYRNGPLAAQPGPDHGGPSSGDRAPDAPCHDPYGRPTRLFELRRGPHWLLLGFGVTPKLDVGPGVPIQIATVTAPGEPPVAPGLVDSDGHAHRAYGAERGDLVLIRPDGYLGTRARSSAEITDYLARIGLPLPTTSAGARPAEVC